MASSTVVAKLAVEIAANTAAFNTALARTESKLDKFQKGIKNISAQLLAGFALIDVGKQLIEVTSQFQRFEAVLTNTLGSNSAAKEAIDGIREFALKTPFEVSEITAAYVRWTNQGLNPTISKMQMLGDVASSLGAGFEQTAEAFKDLAVGQTKRLEEIGISATQQNGKIQLSFKGVNIEIEKNAQGVQKALEVYSQLPGVLGSTAAIAETLGGRVSNLKDAWDNLLLTIGQGNTGVLYNSIQSLTNLAIVAANASVEFELFRKRTAYTLLTVGTLGLGEGLASKLVEFNNLTQDAQEYLLRLGNTASGKKVSDVLGLIEQGKSARELLEDKIDLQKRFNETFLKEGETQNDINAIYYLYLKKLNARYQSEVKSNIEASKAAGLAAKKIADELRQAQAARDKEEAERKAERERAEREKKAEQDWNKKMAAREKVEERYQKMLSERPETLPFGMKSFKDILGDKDGKLPAIKLFTDEQRKAYLKEVESASQSNQQFVKDAEMINQAFSDAASGGIADFLNGLDDVASGQISFGDNIIKALAGFMKQFGQALITIGIGKLNLDKLFTAGPAGAAAAIAAGTALMLAAGAVSRSMGKKAQNIGAGGSSSGGGSGFAGQTVTASGMSSNITITGELKGSGRDLVAVINQTSFDNKVRKGG